MYETVLLLYCGLFPFLDLDTDFDCGFISLPNLDTQVLANGV
jgi:hypothetical protein